MKESKSVPIETDSLAPSFLGDCSIKVMDEVLEEVFCRPRKELVLSLLKENYGLTENDISKRPEAFHKMLKEFFGASGRLIETMILQKIMCKKVKLKRGVGHG